MFFICWEKNGCRGWEKCRKATDIADVFDRNNLVQGVDTVYCLSGGYNGYPMSYQQVLKAVAGELPIKGAFVHTPRVLSVMVSEVFPAREDARAAGFTEPTHYESDYFDILGKSLGLNRMVFAAAMKKQNA